MRCIVVDIKEGKDKHNENASCFWITVYPLAHKYSKGIYHPYNKDVTTYSYCVSSATSPKTYEDYITVLPGTLVDIKLGINDFNEKKFVASAEIVPNTTLLTEDILYL